MDTMGPLEQARATIMDTMALWVYLHWDRISPRWTLWVHWLLGHVRPTMGLNLPLGQARGPLWVLLHWDWLGPRPTMDTMGQLEKARLTSHYGSIGIG